MTWSNFSKESLVRDLEHLVRDAVRHFRGCGCKSEHAIEQAALALDMTCRRARALYYGEAFTASTEEAKRVRDAYIRHLDQQTADLVKRVEAVRAKRRQMELRI